MKTQLNRELVESLSNSNNQEFINKVGDFVNVLLTNAIAEVAQRSAFVSLDKCVLIPVNEIYLGAVSQLSEYDYFLGIDNVQIELNSKTRKNFWKNVWREFRASWRIGRKKYKRQKKQKKEQLEQMRSLDTIEKYKLSDFRSDVAQWASMYLSESSIITEYPRYISFVGKDDFGTNVKVNVFVCIYDHTKNQFKLYNEMKNRYTIVDFGNRFENLDYKVRECGDMFVNMLKIFNALFVKAYNRIPNQILVESLLFNCPNRLFDKSDVFMSFVNVANYIRLANPRSIISICDPSKTIFQEKLITGTNSQVDFTKIINMLDRFNY